MTARKTKLLIVDDSRVFRSIVEEFLKDDETIEIVGSVFNGQKAIKFINENEVDLVTLDVEMPELDGLETLKWIEEYNKGNNKSDISVIMLSSYTKNGADSTIEALALGAFDFITKPDLHNGNNKAGYLKRKLISKIKCWQRGRINNVGVNKGKVKSKIALSKEIKDRSNTVCTNHWIDLIVIGVSTGGPKALTSMLPELCNVTNSPILIVQHMPPGFTKSLAEGLDRKCDAKVLEAYDGLSVENNNVYIAPGGHHMLLRQENNKLILCMNLNPPENGCRPSVDVLFRSAAQIKGLNTVSIVLTGMGTDGTSGLRPLKRAGAMIIAQDEESSVVWGMPSSAIETGLVDQVVPLMKIPQLIQKITLKD